MTPPADSSPYEVHVEWGVRRPDGHVVTMHSEDIARGFADSSPRLTLVSRVVAHIPWTADHAAALAEIDRLRAATAPNQCVDPTPTCDRCIPGAGGHPTDVRTYRHAAPCVHVQRGTYG